MAKSNFQTVQYPSDRFVESAGAILFKVSTKQICLVHYSEKDEWLLSKGRRDIGESRHQTALREAEEETGYKCRLFPVTLTTRAPPVVEDANCPDEPRRYEDVCEPFMLTHRKLDDGVKLIWWYIAAIDEIGAIGAGESQFEAQFFNFSEALNALTYQQDRDVLKRAIEIFEDTYGPGKA